MLEAHGWPPATRFPVNRAGARVRDVVWDDLAHSHQPLLIAGYSSIDRIIEFVTHLGVDPPSRPFDDDAVAVLGRFLDAAARHERLLLPRRMQRALDQMHDTTGAWADRARRNGDEHTAQSWQAIGRLAAHALDDRPDPYLVAERWLDVVGPTRERYRDAHRHLHYVLLRDLDNELRDHPLPIDVVADAFSALPVAAPLAERVTACILGVPEPPSSAPAAGATAGFTSHPGRYGSE